MSEVLHARHEGAEDGGPPRGRHVCCHRPGRPLEAARARGRAWYHAKRDRIIAEMGETSSVAPKACRLGSRHYSWKRMFELQSGRCDICRVIMEFTNGTRVRGPQQMQKDHCHVNIVPRGLLCGSCNMAIGAYEKNQRPAGLRVVQYESYLSDSPLARLNRSKEQEATCSPESD